MLERAGREDAVPGEVVTALVELGPDVVPLLYAILSGELTLTPEGEPPRPRDGAGNRDAILIEALGRLPTERVLEHILAAGTGDAPLDARLLACRVLGEVRDERALEVLIEITEDVEPIHLRRDYVLRPIERSLERILDRHPSLIEGLSPDGFPEEFLPVVVRSLPEGHAEASIDFLLSLFGESGELDSLLMRRLSELAAGPHGLGSFWAEQKGLASVQAYLLDRDWQKRREAAVALGRLQDVSSFPDVIGLLEDEHPSVQGAARWSLEQMSGRSFEDARLWRAWFDVERAWFETELPELEERLASEDDGEVIAVLRELPGHRLYRREIVEVLGPSLGRENPSVVEAICTVLVQLDSVRAVPFLVRGLDHPAVGGREAVGRALRALTGRDLPLERGVWADELGV